MLAVIPFGNHPGAAFAAPPLLTVGGEFWLEFFKLTHYQAVS
jgi:hypothetical protein